MEKAPEPLTFLTKDEEYNGLEGAGSEGFMVSYLNNPAFTAIYEYDAKRESINVIQNGDQTVISRRMNRCY